MKLLDRYKKEITFQVDKPKELILANLVAATKSVPDNDKIHLKIKPSFFDPFAGRGFINLKILATDNGKKTKIECEIIPTSINAEGVYFLASLLLLWTIGGLIISRNFYSFLTVALGWIMMIVVIHMTQVLNQGKLINYIRFIILGIKPMKHKSIA
jgi:hypothetical protein